MTRLTWWFVLLLLLTGCEPRLKGTDPDGTPTYGSFRKCQFEGHDYVIYEEGFAENSVLGLEHDPNCRKCN